MARTQNVTVTATAHVIGLEAYGQPVSLELTQYVQNLIDGGFLVVVGKSAPAAPAAPEAPAAE